jgi:hypothetical protein
MAMSADSKWLDQFEEGDAAGGHAGEVEAIPHSAVLASMISADSNADGRAKAGALGGVLERRRLPGFVKALPCPFPAVEPPC